MVRITTTAIREVQPETPGEVVGIPLEEEVNEDTAVVLIDRRLDWVHFLTKGTLDIEALVLDNKSAETDADAVGTWNAGSDFYFPPNEYAEPTHDILTDDSQLETEINTNLIDEASERSARTQIPASAAANITKQSDSHITNSTSDYSQPTDRRVSRPPKDNGDAQSDTDYTMSSPEPSNGEPDADMETMHNDQPSVSPSLSLIADKDAENKTDDVSNGVSAPQDNSAEPTVDLSRPEAISCHDSHDLKDDSGVSKSNSELTCGEDSTAKGMHASEGMSTDDACTITNGLSKYPRAESNCSVSDEKTTPQSKELHNPSESENVTPTETTSAGTDRALDVKEGPPEAPSRSSANDVSSIDPGKTGAGMEESDEAKTSSSAEATVPLRPDDIDIITVEDTETSKKSKAIELTPEYYEEKIWWNEGDDETPEINRRPVSAAEQTKQMDTFITDLLGSQLITVEKFLDLHIPKVPPKPTEKPTKRQKAGSGSHISIPLKDYQSITLKSSYTAPSKLDLNAASAPEVRTSAESRADSPAVDDTNVSPGGLKTYASKRKLGSGGTGTEKMQSRLESVRNLTSGLYSESRRQTLTNNLKSKINKQLSATAAKTMQKTLHEAIVIPKGPVGSVSLTRDEVMKLQLHELIGTDLNAHRFTHFDTLTKQFIRVRCVDYLLKHPDRSTSNTIRVVNALSILEPELNGRQEPSKPAPKVYRGNLIKAFHRRKQKLLDLSDDEGGANNAQPGYLIPVGGNKASMEKASPLRSLAPKPGYLAPGLPSSQPWPTPQPQIVQSKYQLAGTNFFLVPQPAPTSQADPRYIEELHKHSTAIFHKISSDIKNLSPYECYFHDKSGVPKLFTIKQPRVKLTRLSKAVYNHLRLKPLRVYDKTLAEKRRREQRAARRRGGDDESAGQSSDLSPEKMARLGIDLPTIKPSPAKQRKTPSTKNIEVVDLISDPVENEAEADPASPVEMREEAVFVDGVRQLPPAKKTFPFLTKSLTDLQKETADVGPDTVAKTTQQIQTSLPKTVVVQPKYLFPKSLRASPVKPSTTAKPSPSKQSAAANRLVTAERSSPRKGRQPATQSASNLRSPSTSSTNTGYKQYTYDQLKRGSTLKKSTGSPGGRHRPGRLIPSFSNLQPPPTKSKLTFPKSLTSPTKSRVNGHRAKSSGGDNADGEDDDDIIMIS